MNSKILNPHLIYNEENLSRALQFRRDLVDNMTYREKIVLHYLKKLEYRFEFQKIIYVGVGKFFIADFFLKDYGIVIEVDGRHHGKQALEDAERTRRLLESGVKGVIRLPNYKCNWGEWTKNYISKKIIKEINKHSNGYKKFQKKARS